MRCGEGVCAKIVKQTQKVPNPMQLDVELVPEERHPDQQVLNVCLAKQANMLL